LERQCGRKMDFNQTKMASIKAKYEKELYEAISKKEWARVAVVCEEYEMDLWSSNEQIDIGTLPHYSVQLITYLILNDLVNARFLWKRIPSPVKSGRPELGSIWTIGKAMWQKNYIEVYKSIRGVNWPDAYKPLLAVLEEVYRSRMITLLSKAYTAISLVDAQILLGLSLQDVQKVASLFGWKIDQGNNICYPQSIQESKVQTTSLPQLQQLTDYVCYLEH